MDEKQEEGIGQHEENEDCGGLPFRLPIIVSFCEPDFLAFHATFGTIGEALKGCLGRWWYWWTR
jgi:hypothetical protein